MIALEIVLGAGLGAAGAALHLAVVHARATRFTRAVAQGRSTALVMWSMPLGWLGPAAAVLAATRIGHVAAWSTIVGIAVARTIALHLHAGSPP